MNELKKRYEAIVIGSSAGGLAALSAVLSNLPEYFSIPVIAVQQRTKTQNELLEELLQHKCKIKIKQAEDKEKIQNGCVYFAPPDYHLLIEENRTFSLSIDESEYFNRPSIDVLFETAAKVYKNNLIGIILTGSNQDGAEGIKKIKKQGGTTIAQNPTTAQFPVMPQAAIDTGCIDYILDTEEIQNWLLKNNK